MSKITIFGMAGTGKSSAGKELAKKLNYGFFSAGDFARATAEKLGITLHELEMLSKTDPKYDLERDKVMTDFGKNNDNFVVEARLAWHFIPDSFKVNLFCDFDTRVARVASREKKDFDLAKMETIEREKAIYERFAKYYGLDLDKVIDGSPFDLSLDTKTNSIEEVVDSILSKELV